MVESGTAESFDAAAFWAAGSSAPAGSADRANDRVDAPARFNTDAESFENVKWDKMVTRNNA
jgi:hypothetical protein